MAAAATATAQAAPLRKEQESLRDELLRDLSALPKTPSAHAPNAVEGHYIINPGQPLPAFDTALAKAYAVTDSRDPAKQLYALVCNTQMPVRGNAMKVLKGASVPNMVTLYAHEVIELSGIQGRRLVLIYDKPRGKTLLEIMTERGKTLPDQFISEHIITPLCSILQYFTENSISHGRIHPGNIWFSDVLTLGECISEPCGYSQPFQFETPERAQALAAGKGESTPANDMFSIGLLAGYLRLGERLFKRAPTYEEHLSRMLGNGSYAALTTNIDFSDMMTDLLRGTLNDRVKERWLWEQLKPWCKGRRYNMLPPTGQSHAMRPFVIQGQEYYSLRELSQGLYTHWDSTMKAVRDNVLIRWMELSARRKEIAELLRRAYASVSTATAATMQQTDEVASRTITILDPLAPLSMKEVRAHPEGLGGVIAEGFRTGNTAYIEQAMEIIEQGLAVVWADMYKRVDEEPPGDSANTLWQLDRMRVVSRIPGFGFGLERVLYDLNPDLPCQSTLLTNHHAANIKDLLLSLEHVATERMRDGPPFDRHIAAFIASKLNLSKESKLSEYHANPRLGHHPAFIMLRMLEQAQDSCGKPKLPALCLWMSAELVPVLDLFHSKGAREQLRMGIKQMAEGGLFAPISSYFNQRGFAATETEGYGEAIQAYIQCSEEIASLRDKVLQKRKAAISGYSVANYIAHMGLLLTFLLVLQTLF